MRGGANVTCEEKAYDKTGTRSKDLSQTAHNTLTL